MFSKFVPKHVCNYSVVLLPTGWTITGVATGTTPWAAACMPGSSSLKLFGQHHVAQPQQPATSARMKPIAPNIVATNFLVPRSQAQSTVDWHEISHQEPFSLQHTSSNLH